MVIVQIHSYRQRKVLLIKLQISMEQLQDASSIQNIKETFQNHDASCTANTYTTLAYRKYSTNRSFICVVYNRFHLTLSPEKVLHLCYKTACNQA